MTTYFYYHLISIDTIHAALEDLDLEAPERIELKAIVESSIHHLVVDTILSELSEEDKQIFLHHMAHKQHDKLWKHISAKIDRAEEKIQQAVDRLITDLHQDIQAIKNGV